MNTRSRYSFLSSLLTIALLFFLVFLTRTSVSSPIPEESKPETTPESSRKADSDYPEDFSPPPLVVLPDDDDDSSSGGGGGSDGGPKRGHGPPTPEELEARRVALIKALGGGRDDAEGGGGGGGGGISASIQGLGSLATDVIMLFTANSNETFAPLREARQKARQNFPDFGTALGRTISGSREYAARAYRGLRKTLRVTATNALRFMLQVLTRLGSTLGGLYNVALSVLDLVTRGITNGARVGSRLISAGTNATLFTLARGTNALRNVAQNGHLLRPVTQAVNVGRGFAKGVSEDLFNKVEWAQEGISSKLELAQALAPNFLLRAHDQPTSTSSYEPPVSSCCGDNNGGYDDSGSSFLPLSASASEKMEESEKKEEKRDGRGVDKIAEMMMMMVGINRTDGASTSTSSTTVRSSSTGTTGGSSSSSSSSSTTTPTSTATSGSSSTTTTTSKTPDDKTTRTPPSPPPPPKKREPDSPPQELLNDIFGLQSEIDKIKQTSNGTSSSTTTGTPSSSSSSTTAKSTTGRNE